MFNAGLKKEAQEGLKRAGNRYQSAYSDLIRRIERLHADRLVIVKNITSVEDLVNSIANKPKEFDKTLSEINRNRLNFENDIRKLEKLDDEALATSLGIAGAGVAGGAGLAAFGPTAAMAITTTFGTASTETAIASLSGAAATNAALA